MYEEALAVELQKQGICCTRQLEFEIDYKGTLVGRSRLDIIAGTRPNRVILGLKSVQALLLVHRAQLISYLKATRITLGLLINFNVDVLKSGIEPVICSQSFQKK